MRRLERRVSACLLTVLNLADQARLEGPRGTINSSAAIESASTLIRIAYRFELIARRRTAGSDARTSQGLLERQAAFEAACCSVLERQLATPQQRDLTEAGGSAAPVEDLTSMTGGLYTVESADSSPRMRIMLATGTRNLSSPSGPAFEPREVAFENRQFLIVVVYPYWPPEAAACPACADARLLVATEFFPGFGLEYETIWSCQLVFHRQVGAAPQ